MSLALPYQNWFADGPVSAVADDSAVERIPFDRFAARFADHPVQLIDRQAFGSFRPCVVVDQFVNHRSVEVVRAEGLNEFANLKNTNLSAATLAPYSVVVLGDVAITDAQVTALTDWVNAGGNLIAMRPDSRLLGLAGLTAQSGTVSNGYLAVDASTEPGAGITTETMQFHGPANRYALSGATAVAGLFTTATASTGQPAVTWRSEAPAKPWRANNCSAAPRMRSLVEKCWVFTPCCP